MRPLHALFVVLLMTILTIFTAQAFAANTPVDTKSPATVPTKIKVPKPLTTAEEQQLQKLTDQFLQERDRFRELRHSGAPDTDLKAQQQKVEQAHNAMRELRQQVCPREGMGRGPGAGQGSGVGPGMGRRHGGGRHGMGHRGMGVPDEMMGRSPGGGRGHERGARMHGQGGGRGQGQCAMRQHRGDGKDPGMGRGAGPGRGHGMGRGMGQGMGMGRGMGWRGGMMQPKQTVPAPEQPEAEK